jgi:hypothetical protein
VLFRSATLDPNGPLCNCGRYGCLEALASGPAIAARAQMEAELRATRQRLEAIEAERNAKPVPDKWQEPDAYEAHREQQQQTAFQQIQVQLAKTQAYARFGYDAVETAMQEALQAAAQNPQLDRMLSSAPNPFAAAVEWHKQASVIREVGTDPAAYKARVRQEAVESLKADPEFRKQLLAELRAEAGTTYPPGTGQRQSTIPSMNGVATSGGRKAAGDERMLSEDELFRL